MKRTIVKNNKMTTKIMMYVVIFSALAVVLGFFQIPLGTLGGKLDLSEVVILAAFLILGFKYTFLIIILRSAIRFILPAVGAIEASNPLWKLLGEGIAIIATLLIILSFVIFKKITKMKQKPLILECNINIKKIKIKHHVINALLTALILTTGMTIFHTIFTMPMAYSGIFNGDFSNFHFTIFSFIKDPLYNQDNSVKLIITAIILEFGIMNVVKGVLTSIIFLLVKPKLENIVI